ncbi:hypothetical protein ILUMI_25409 [Ignelater luminosus]|uniref:Cytochrome P450 n=1 Tax=Ignelater luminosus TaxID=2038154 RepID=A0A8K0C5L5_IGNLU|nr:hypothetical protein ILUMI_25409 [Ignelater luminosus]
MSFSLDNICYTWITIPILLITTFVIYFKWKYTYWEKHNVPFIQPQIPFGNLENSFKRKTPPCIEAKNFYHEFKSKGAKHGGIYSFGTPVYIPIDLDYIKNILSTDFQYFTERGRYYNEKDDPLSAHLFNIGGKRWRSLRTKLTPTFTSGKMKTMFLTLLECGKILQNAVEESYAKTKPVEIRNFAWKFTTDVIGSCVFGIECNSFANQYADFPKYGKMLLKGSPWEAARMAFIFSFPNLAKSLGIRRFDKRATDFFTNIVKDTVEYRESNNVRRNDFMQILIDLKNTPTVDVEGDGEALTMEQLTAQCAIFFIGGFDTSAAAISFSMYEMARNHEIQQKVRDEINEIMVRYDGKLTYDGLTELKYMQQVIDETLRKYPSLTILNRQCVETYKIPNSDVTIEKGTQILIPLMGLHSDPDYYPDPDRFDPERFSPENKKARNSFSYLPFGNGPRNCIAMRFGIMQVKTGLCMLLKNYKYSINPNTKEPLELDMGVMCCAKDGIWLDVAKI